MPATVLTPTSSRICFSLLFSLAPLAWLGSQIKTTTIKHYKHLVRLREKPLHWVRPNRRTEQNSDSNPSQKPEPGLRLQICTMCHSCQWRVITIIITLFFFFAPSATSLLLLYGDDDNRRRPTQNGPTARGVLRECLVTHSSTATWVKL